MINSFCEHTKCLHRRIYNKYSTLIITWKCPYICLQLHYNYAAHKRYRTIMVSNKSCVDLWRLPHLKHQHRWTSVASTFNCNHIENQQTQFSLMNPGEAKHFFHSLESKTGQYLHVRLLTLNKITGQRSKLCHVSELCL